jgi:hypothetical protein
MIRTVNTINTQSKKGQNENEGDIEESQVSMVIDEDVDSDSQYEMENEKDVSDSEIESDLEEDIVFTII